MNPRTFFLPILLSLLLQACTSVNPPQKPEPEAPADCLLQFGFRQIDLVRTDYHLAMQVKINGRPATMVIATNNPISQFDRKLLRKFHLKEKSTDVPVSSSFGGSQRLGLVRLKTLEISNAVFRQLDVAIVNLNARPGVDRYDGIFALSELRKAGGIIDCDHRVLYFNLKGPDREASVRLRTQLAHEGFTRVPLRLISHDSLMEAPCAINGHQSRMIVSAESFVTVLMPQTAVKTGVYLSQTASPGFGLGGDVGVLQAARVRELSIGDFRISNVKLNVATSPLNSLGIDQLELNHAIIDVGALALYLKRPSDK